MSVKESNEITLKIKGKLEDFYKIIEEKGFYIDYGFSMNDAYFIPENLKLDKMSTREILAKAVLVREINGKISGKITKQIAFKIKKFDEDGNILDQKAVSCDVLDIEDAKNLLTVIGYQELMYIKEDDVVYEKDGFQLAIKDIRNGDKLIEVETNENDEFDSIEKLINRVNQLDIPIYTDNYFVKKAEIELNKVLKR